MLAYRGLLKSSAEPHFPSTRQTLSLVGRRGQGIIDVVTQEQVDWATFLKRQCELYKLYREPILRTRARRVRERHSLDVGDIEHPQEQVKGL